jgi:dUTP pyrophosphatase
LTAVFLTLIGQEGIFYHTLGDEIWGLSCISHRPGGNMNCGDNNKDWDSHDDGKTIFCEVLDNGKLPCKAHQTDAGFDLFAAEDLVIRSGQITRTLLDIRLHLPKDTYVEFVSKSGLGLSGLLIFASVIDEEYRGVPSVVCTNLTSKTDTFYGKEILVPGEPIVIKKGQKIAQMIPYPFSTNYRVEQVQKVSSDTSRSENGFGSSGK